MITIDQQNKALVEFIVKQADRRNPLVEVWQSEESITINAGLARVTFLAPWLENGENFERVTIPARVLKGLPVSLVDFGDGETRVTYPEGLVMHQYSAHLEMPPGANREGGLLGSLTMPPSFLEALGNVAPAASKADTRYILQGVNVQATFDGLKLAACDGRMLRVVHIPTRAEGPKPNLTIPSPLVAQLLKLPASIKKDCVIQMGWGEKFVTFEVHARVGAVQLEAGILEWPGDTATRQSYPDYGVVTPAPGDMPITVTVDAKSLSNALEAIKPAWCETTTATRGIMLRLDAAGDSGALHVEGVGNSTILVPTIKEPSAALSVAFDPQWLLTLLGTYRGAVTLRFKDELTPCLMGREEMTDYAVLMPCRLA
jgi:hypothetical protein